MVDKHPNPSQELLANLSDVEFGDWILRSMVGFHEEGKGRFAFRPYDSHFEREFSVAYDLVMFFQKLPAGDRSNFKRGLAIALKETGSRNPNPDILKTLFEVAQQTNAAVVLPVLLAMLRENAENDEFVKLSLSVLSSLATNAGDTSRTHVAVECLEVLSRSPALDSLSFVSAFILMCKLRPDNVAQNLSMFRANVDLVLGYSNDDPLEARRTKQRSILFESLLKVASPNSIFQSMKTDQQYYEGMNWWRDLLLLDNKHAEELLRRVSLTEPHDSTIIANSPPASHSAYLTQKLKNFPRMSNALIGIIVLKFETVRARYSRAAD
jgi:hypothetical protein